MHLKLPDTTRLTELHHVSNLVGSDASSRFRLLYHPREKPAPACSCIRPPWTAASTEQGFWPAWPGAPRKCLSQQFWQL